MALCPPPPLFSYSSKDKTKARLLPKSSILLSTDSVSPWSRWPPVAPAVPSRCGQRPGPPRGYSEWGRAGSPDPIPLPPLLSPGPGRAPHRGSSPQAGNPKREPPKKPHFGARAEGRTQHPAPPAPPTLPQTPRSQRRGQDPAAALEPPSPGEQTQDFLPPPGPDPAPRSPSSFLCTLGAPRPNKAD